MGVSSSPASLQGGETEEGNRSMISVACRPQEEVHADEDLQQITVQVEPTCSVEIVVPTQEDAG